MADNTVGGAGSAASGGIAGGVFSYALDEVEAAVVGSLVEKLSGEFPDPAAPAFFDSAWSFIPEIPRGLQGALVRFRLTEFVPALLITGFEVDDAALGETPPDVQTARERDAGRREEYLIALVAAALGEAFNWSTLQMGRLIHDVIPIQGEEMAQSGHGSTASLEWHTEDAFHQFRADYLLLLGLRNLDHVPTTVASIRDVDLSPGHLATLREPRFHIVPDNEHIDQLARAVPGHPALLRMQELRDSPPRVPVLFGDASAPYLRIDPVYMRIADGESDSESALSALQGALHAALEPVVLSPGDLLIVDNYLAVHGRGAFKARHDGTDRWLKKALVTRDLRKSRDHRAAAASRVLA